MGVAVDRAAAVLGSVGACELNCCTSMNRINAAQGTVQGPWLRALGGSVGGNTPTHRKTCYEFNSPRGR